MATMPTMEEMLKAGVHFGHQVSKRHPKMMPYVFGVRNGITVIDLAKTETKLREALDFVRQTASEGGLIVFVGTKRQAKDIVKKYAADCGMPYVTNRWMGGLLTNFDVIGKVIRKYKDLRAKQESGELAKYTKKEQSSINKYLNKMEEMVGGLLNLNRIPAAVYVVDLKAEATAKSEALSKGLPVIAIADSNVNPEGIAYPIPANDDATKSIELITSLIAAAAKEGSANRKEPVKAAVSEAKPAMPVAPARTMKPKAPMAKAQVATTVAPATPAASAK